MRDIDNYYLKQAEPTKSCFLALQQIILSQDKEVTNVLKYGMPFFCYKGKMFCYLWHHKTYKLPYIGIVEGKYFDEAYLIQEKRARMKIMLIDPSVDLPIEAINNLLQKALNLYRTGKVKI